MSAARPRTPAGRDGATNPREPYEPPSVTYTEIEVEEALMSMCKTTGITGPVGATCAFQPCSGPGS